jgi:predicted lactoylglutathione lyase
MVGYDTIFFMLLSRERFANFTSKAVIDARSSVEALLCLSRDSRAEVEPILELPARKTMGSCTAAASRTSTAISSSRYGWMSMRPLAAMSGQWRSEAT